MKHSLVIAGLLLVMAKLCLGEVSGTESGSGTGSDPNAITNVATVNGATAAVNYGVSNNIAYLKALIPGSGVVITDSGTTLAIAVTNITASVTNTSKSFLFDSPTSTSDYPIGSFGTATTIDALRVLCTGPTNVIGGIDICDANGNNPIPLGTDVTATNGGVVVSGSLTNTAVPINSMLAWHTTSVSGAVSNLVVTIYLH